MTHPGNSTVKGPKAIAALLLALGLILLITHFAAGRIRVFRLSDGKIITLERMVQEVKGARVIFVGEEHDRKRSHTAELEIIERLRRAGVPLGIGLEMFTAESQGKLDQWVAGKLPPDDFIRLYYRNWHMPWPYYRDILIYARDNRVPLIGLNVPEEISSKVAREGFAALTPRELAQLPRGITCSVDPYYRAFIREAYGEHPHSDLSFTYFCEAQMLWNRSMGRNLLEYLARTPGRSIVVLAGVGHAMKRGIPEETFRDTGYAYKVVLPRFADLDRSTLSAQNADYLLLFN